MSNATYINNWSLITQKLESQLELENIKDQNLTPKDRESNVKHTLVLYIRYLGIYKLVELTYDQTVHPQKRRVLRELLLAVIGRLIEVKHRLVELDASDFTDLESTSLDEKLTPDDLEIPVPRFCSEESKSVQEKREEELRKLNAKMFTAPAPKNILPELSVEQAALIIQRHERGRQGKLRAKYMRDIKLQEENLSYDVTKDEAEVALAVIRIQKVWRGYLARREYALMQREELQFLGMSDPRRRQVNDVLTRVEANFKRRKALQQQHEEEYQVALGSIKEKLLKIDGPDIKETWQDNFRQWYLSYKKEHNQLPEYPQEDEWNQPNFKFAQKKNEGQTDKAAEVRGGKKNTSAEKLESTSATEVKSTFLTSIKKLSDVYVNQWANKDETENFAQKHDAELIKAEKKKEVEKEIKQELYIVLKEELDNLKLTLEDAKKGKKKGGSAKKAGKKKDTAAKKGKKEKDLTAGRTEESLVEELVQSGIMQLFQKISLSEFKGGENLMAAEGTKHKTITQPSYADLRRVITEYCVLPLTLPTLDDNTNWAVSILLYGPEGVGKSMLVQAIATEVGASFFDITPKNTEGQFIGKANTTKMVHAVFKVAKLRAPSIIYIDDAETIFAKKPSKDDTSDSKRIRKDLAKHVATLTPMDRVLVIGNSRRPFDADAKSFGEAFQKFVYIPKPDFSNRIKLWEQFILDFVVSNSAGAVVDPVNLFKYINLPLLARMTDGFSTADIEVICAKVMCPWRVRVLYKRPLRNAEFVKMVLKIPQPDKNIENAFKEFQSTLPLQKKRETQLSVGAQDEDKPKKRK
ncbi:hypothetical protein BKA69DRAFT_727651 [Paraphysoderma sedebokerense]|nr:hypothetical protein BKA69DRAFT_727651 [Paraphysoderma sedebokerense]